MTLTDISLLVAGIFFLIIFSGLFMSLIISKRRNPRIPVQVVKNVPLKDVRPIAPVSISGSNIRVHKLNTSVPASAQSRIVSSAGKTPVNEINTVFVEKPLRLQVLNSPVSVNYFARDYYNRVQN